MKPDFTPLQFLLLVFSGWINHEQQAIIDYLREENAVLHEQLEGRRIRFTDAQRRRLAVKGKALGRKILGEVAGIVTPDTILRWYRHLVAKKYDGSKKRGSGWKSFINAHLGAIVSADFFTVEVLTWSGLVRYSVLFFLDLETRMVEIAGITPAPSGAWMKQIVRNVTDEEDVVEDDYC